MSENKTHGVRIDAENLGAGVYMLLRKGVVVYVGMSKGCMLARVGAHTEDKVFDEVELQPHPHATVEELKLRESVLILEHRPEYNYGRGKKTAGRLLLSSRHVGPNRGVYCLPDTLQGLHI
jgi:hypothetical protein